MVQTSYEQSTGHQKKILCICANSDMSYLIRAILRARGLDSQSAGTVQEGLRIAQQQKPDLILLDLGVPDTDEWELRWQIGEVGQLVQVPVIGLVSWGPYPPIPSPFQFDAYVRKLSILDELADAVFRVLGVSVDYHPRPDAPKAPLVRPKGISERRMLARAQRLIRKYTRPNPPGMGPPVAIDDGILDAWAWAEATDRIDILSALALPACAFFKSPEEQQSMRLKLRKFAEQAKSEQRWKEYADFLMALAKLESDESNKLALYEEALEVYTRLDDWAGEAICASLAAAIYRHRRQFDKVHRLYLRSYKLWAKAQHKKGIASSLEGLADLLVVEGRYIDACRLIYRAKKLLGRSWWAIGTRDFLSYVSHEYKVSREQYETKKTDEELVSEIFGP